MMLSRDHNAGHSGMMSAVRTYGPTAALMTTNNLVYNMLFIVLGVIATQRGYNEQQIGFVGSAFLFGQTLANLSGPLWVNRVGWRRVVVACSIVAMGALLVAPSLSFFPFLICYMLAGAMTGFTLSCVFCGMSQMADSIRAYSISLVSQCVVAGTLIYVTQVLIAPRFGLFGLTLLLITCFAVSAVAGLLFSRPNPDSATKSDSHGGGVAGVSDLASRNNRAAGLIALAGIAIYFLGQTGIWAFLERIGNAKGFSPEFIGAALALVLILCALGGWAATLTGNRLGAVLPIVLGQVLFLVCMAVLALSNGRTPYFIAVLIYASAWNYVLPFQMLIVSRYDRNGVLASTIPAFQSIGSSIGPAVVGSAVAAYSSYTSTYIMCSVITLVSLAFFALAGRGFLSGRHDAEAALGG